MDSGAFEDAYPGPLQVIMLRMVSGELIDQEARP